MNYILQIYTGSLREKGPEADEIIRGLSGLPAGLRFDSVIIGWSADPSLYGRVGAFLRETGRKLLLWLPVFSSAGGTAVYDAAKDVFGNPVAASAQQAGDGFALSARRHAAICRLSKTYMRSTSPAAALTACSWTGLEPSLSPRACPAC